MSADTLKQLLLNSAPKQPISERVGRAAGIFVRVFRNMTIKAGENDANQPSGKVDDLVDLDLTAISEEEGARAFGITVEELRDLESNAYQYVINCFALLKEEIPYGIISVYISSYLEGGDELAEDEVAAKIACDPDLVDKGVNNCLSDMKVAERMSEEETRELIEFVRLGITQIDFGSIKEALEVNPIVGNQLEFYEIKSEIIGRNRNFAVSEMDDSDYRSVISEWVNIEGALSDEELARYFEREKFDKRYLTTFFDTCQFGMVNKELVRAAAKFDQRTEFMECVNICKNRIVRHFERLPNSREDERRFLPENCAFTRNGTNAFRLFYDKYLKDGDTVMVTSEEYGEMVHMLKGELEGVPKKDINVVILDEYSCFKSDDDYAKHVREKAEAHNANYFLVSVVGRRGTVFPLDKINDVLEDSDKTVDIIADAAQALGRKVLDFHKSKPAVVIASCQKGTDFGGPVGLIALAKDFVELKEIEMNYVEDPESGEYKPYLELSESDKKKLAHLYRGYKTLEFNNTDEIGTLNKTDMARFMYGVNPFLLRSLCDKGGRKLPECLTMSVEEREDTNHALACNFLKLLRVINEKNENRVKILYPANLYSEDGEIQEERVSNIFELKIEGMKRTNKNEQGEIISEEPGVMQIAERLGITIQDYYDEAEEGVSFRIAFHPFMNNDSIKILGFVLQKCCEIAKGKDIKNSDESEVSNIAA